MLFSLPNLVCAGAAIGRKMINAISGQSSFVFFTVSSLPIVIGGRIPVGSSAGSSESLSLS
jgi:hypothetical protein